MNHHNITYVSFLKIFESPAGTNRMEKNKKNNVQSKK